MDPTKYEELKGDPNKLKELEEKLTSYTDDIATALQSLSRLRMDESNESIIRRKILSEALETEAIVEIGLAGVKTGQAEEMESEFRATGKKKVHDEAQRLASSAQGLIEMARSKLSKLRAIPEEQRIKSQRKLPNRGELDTDAKNYETKARAIVGDKAKETGYTEFEVAYRSAYEAIQHNEIENARLLLGNVAKYAAAHHDEQGMTARYHELMLKFITTINSLAEKEKDLWMTYAREAAEASRKLAAEDSKLSSDFKAEEEKALELLLRKLRDNMEAFTAHPEEHRLNIVAAMEGIATTSKTLASQFPEKEKEFRALAEECEKKLGELRPDAEVTPFGLGEGQIDLTGAQQGSGLQPASRPATPPPVPPPIPEDARIPKPEGQPEGQPEEAQPEGEARPSWVASDNERLMMAVNDKLVTFGRWSQSDAALTALAEYSDRIKDPDTKVMIDELIYALSNIMEALRSVDGISVSHPTKKDLGDSLDLLRKAKKSIDTNRFKDKFEKMENALALIDDQLKEAIMYVDRAAPEMRESLLLFIRSAAGLYLMEDTARKAGEKQWELKYKDLRRSDLLLNSDNVKKVMDIAKEGADSRRAHDALTASFDAIVEYLENLRKTQEAFTTKDLFREYLEAVQVDIGQMIDAYEVEEKTPGGAEAKAMMLELRDMVKNRYR